MFGSQISEEITNKYSSNIINESNNNEKLPEIKSKSISDNESIHSVEELYQNKPSSSNLDPIISNNLDNNDIVISKVGVKEEKKVDYQKNNNTINLENDPQFSKSEKMTGTKEEDSKTLLDKSYSSNNNNDEDSKKQFVTEKTAENKDQKKKGFFSSLFGKRKSQVDSKVLSTDEQKNKQNNQGKSNSDKNEDNATNKNEISEKNKNKDKNEVKYLSDDDLDELLKE